MITELEQKELKLLFRGRYTEDVLKILSQRNVCNRNGEPHNAKYVRMVFQGIRRNADIESAIWHLAEQRKREIKYQQQKKQNILK